MNQKWGGEEVETQKYTIQNTQKYLFLVCSETNLVFLTQSFVPELTNWMWLLLFLSSLTVPASLQPPLNPQTSLIRNQQFLVIKLVGYPQKKLVPSLMALWEGRVGVKETECPQHSSRMDIQPHPATDWRPFDGYWQHVSHLHWCELNVCSMSLQSSLQNWCLWHIRETQSLPQWCTFKYIAYIIYVNT